MIRNLDTDPNAFTRRYSWGAVVTRRDDGRYTYTGNGNSFMGSCKSNLAIAVPVGHVIVLITRTADASFADARIWRADELFSAQDDDIYVKVSRITETGSNHEISINACTSGVTILGSALYAPDDWTGALDLYNAGILPYPWIDGEYLHSGGGMLS